MSDQQSRYKVTITWASDNAKVEKEIGRAPRVDEVLSYVMYPDVFVKFARAQDVPFSILLPAFITSELKTAFQIGFMLFLPFLVIDLVVSSVLMSLGMMMMSPTIVSLPFKLLLFVLVDGWALLMGSLAASFG